MAREAKHEPAHQAERPITETKEEDLWDPEKAKHRILKWWDVVRNLQLITVGLAHAESIDLQRTCRRASGTSGTSTSGSGGDPVAMKDNTPEFLEQMNG